MKRVTAILLLLLALTAVTHALARNGQSADDCPPGTKDPDCADAAK